MPMPDVVGTVYISGDANTVQVSNTVAVAGTVSVGNTPTVLISSSGNTVQVSNTVAISGAVTVSNTPNVNVSNNPTVLISGTGNTVQVSNTVTVSGTVSIGNSPTVAISGTANTVQVSNTVAITGAITVTSGTVNIGNTPTVGILGTANTVQVSNTVAVSGAVTVTSGTVSIGNSPTVLISGTGNTVQISNTVAISGAVSITSGTVSIGGTPNVNVTAGTVNIAGQPIQTKSPMVSLGTITVPIGNTIAQANYTLPSGTQSLFVTLVGIGAGQKHLVLLQVVGVTTGALYHNDTVGMDSDDNGDSQTCLIPVDTSQDASVTVKVVIDSNATTVFDMIAYVSATINPAATAVMGFRGGPPVQVSVPPSVRVASAQSSSGVTTTIVAGVTGKVMRIWSAQITGRAASSTGTVTVEIQDTSGNYILVAEGYGGTGLTQFFGGLELGAGVGCQIVAGGAYAIFGTVTYDFAN